MNSKRKYAWVLRVAIVSLCALAVVLLISSRNPKAQAQTHVPVSMTTDWSTHHMVYSAPSSVQQALKLQTEPRYLRQLIQRNGAGGRSAQ